MSKYTRLGITTDATLLVLQRDAEAALAKIHSDQQATQAFAEALLDGDMAAAAAILKANGFAEADPNSIAIDPSVPIASSASWSIGFGCRLHVSSKGFSIRCNVRGGASGGKKK